MDTDVDIDTEFDTDTGIGFHFVSLKNLVAFFTIFGWVGIACIQADLGKAITIVIDFNYVVFLKFLENHNRFNGLGCFKFIGTVFAIDNLVLRFL